MTDDVYKILTAHERHLLTAKMARYVTGMGSRSAGELIGAYNALYGEHRPVTTCSRCLLKICERLAEDYFPEKERRECDASV